MEYSFLPEDCIGEIIGHISNKNLALLVGVSKKFFDMCKLRAKKIDTVEKYLVACSQGDYLSLQWVWVSGKIPFWLYRVCDLTNFPSPQSENHLPIDTHPQSILPVNSVLNHSLRNACDGRHRELVRFLISKGIGGTREFHLVCQWGDLGMVCLMMDMLSKKTLGKGWMNYGLDGACHGGHLDLVKFIMYQGATNLDMTWVCYGGNLDLVKFCVDKGVIFDQDDIEQACYGGHYKVVKYILDSPSDKKSWIDRENNPNTTLNECLMIVCLYGFLDIAELLVIYGANDYDMGLEYACSAGYVDTALFMIECGANNWDESLCMACRAGHLELVKLLVDRGATDFQRSIVSAIDRYDRESLNKGNQKFLSDLAEVITYLKTKIEIQT
jgi:ankyrin repeat protein